MTAKMVEAERNKIEEFVEAGHTLSEDQASALLMEVDRARASESALADALTGTAPAVDADGPCWCGPVEKKNGRHYDAQCVERRAALKRAGR